eukprot:scaffold318_cov269-Pinguiococcus_pyrenoidosus.AAC.8
MCASLHWEKDRSFAPLFLGRFSSVRLSLTPTALQDARPIRCEDEGVSEGDAGEPSGEWRVVGAPSLRS